MTNFWENKRVLVTGAGGFKGSHLVEKLADKCETISLVRDFDPKSYFETQNLGKKSIRVIGDLKDFTKISDILTKYEITNIFHLGAQPIVTTALKNPKETLESNIMGTVNILEASRLFSKIDGIVVVSSDKAYGSCERLPYTETERLQGRAPYDVSKSCADLIAQMYAKTYSMPVTVARCANVFGPGDWNMSRIVPGIMDSIIKNKTLDIRSDGKMMREYIYVKDAVDAYISLGENIQKTKGEAFNVASKQVYNVLELLDKISSALGKKIDYRILNISKYEIPNQHLDGRKIFDFIGWEPKTPINKAIQETYKWYEEIL